MSINYDEIKEITPSIHESKLIDQKMKILHTLNLGRQK
jgi:hypothetical protein